MGILNIAEENRWFENILPAIISLKESNKVLLLEQEKIEEQNYSNAQAVLESSSYGEKTAK